MDLTVPAATTYTDLALRATGSTNGRQVMSATARLRLLTSSESGACGTMTTLVTDVVLDAAGHLQIPAAALTA